MQTNVFHIERAELQMPQKNTDALTRIVRGMILPAVSCQATNKAHFRMELKDC